MANIEEGLTPRETGVQVLYKFNRNPRRRQLSGEMALLRRIMKISVTVPFWPQMHHLGALKTKVKISLTQELQRQVRPLADFQFFQVILSVLVNPDCQLCDT